jgi:hypothetical protein
MVGYNAEFHWRLMLDNDQCLDEKVWRIGEEYEFTTDGHKIYPLDTLIQLVNEEWMALASVMVREFTIGDGKTRGRYQVLRVYDEKTKQIISENI